MSRLKIDVESLLMALEDQGYEVSHWLDLKTGEIIPTSDYLEMEGDDEFQTSFDDDPFRFRRIESIPSWQGYNIMSDFVQQLPESKAKNDLAYALQRKRPFRNFKDTLLAYPDLREEWFQFHAQELKQLAKQWLHDESIEADLVPYSEWSKEQDVPHPSPVATNVPHPSPVADTHQARTHDVHPVADTHQARTHDVHPVADTHQARTHDAHIRRTVAILLFDDVEVLDFAGPFEVFAVTDELSDYTLFNVFTVALTPEPIRARNGLSVNPDFALTNAPQVDIVIIPGGNGTRAVLKTPPALEWIHQTAQHAELVLSVCSGALVLAKADLLAGLQATTHHEVLAELATLAPDTKIVKDQRYVDNGKIITAAGISAGIDMSLYVVEKLCGQAHAQKTAQYMEYFRKFD